MGQGVSPHNHPTSLPTTEHEAREFTIRIHCLLYTQTLLCHTRKNYALEGKTEEPYSWRVAEQYSCLRASREVLREYPLRPRRKATLTYPSFSHSLYADDLTNHLDFILIEMMTVTVQDVKREA